MCAGKESLFPFLFLATQETVSLFPFFWLEPSPESHQWDEEGSDVDHSWPGHEAAHMNLHGFLSLGVEHDRLVLKMGVSQEEASWAGDYNHGREPPKVLECALREK